MGHHGQWLANLWVCQTRGTLFLAIDWLAYVLPNCYLSVSASFDMTALYRREFKLTITTSAFCVPCFSTSMLSHDETKSDMELSISRREWHAWICEADMDDRQDPWIGKGPWVRKGWGRPVPVMTFDYPLISSTATWSLCSWLFKVLIFDPSRSLAWIWVSESCSRGLKMRYNDSNPLDSITLENNMASNYIDCKKLFNLHVVLCMCPHVIADCVAVRVRGDDGQLNGSCTAITRQGSDSRVS
jgi:hypothetical protein